MSLADVDPRAVPGTYPVPDGRGRWRILLQNRTFGAPAVIVGELTTARSRRLDKVINQPAQFTFVLDGHDPAAALITELTQDVRVLRWDDQHGADVIMFRGIISQSQDAISEQTHTVTFTCKDYLAMMGRRIFPNNVTISATDQDDIVGTFVNSAVSPRATDGTSFSPGGYLPISLARINPDGSVRAAKSGQVRDRTYTGGSPLDQLLNDLSAVINGFDYDISPAANYQTVADQLRVFYPYQGVQRATPELVYGSSVTALTRSVNSADYANYARVVGSPNADGSQLVGEYWNADSNNITIYPIGLWQTPDSIPDATLQPTLLQKAQGDIAADGVLIPSYSLTLRPGVYSWGNPNMGDTLPLIIFSGRLQVNTLVRVMGISYDIGDDGQEDVSLTVGRPDVTLSNIFTAQDHTVSALTRR
jgi:hypothetical protein